MKTKLLEEAKLVAWTFANNHKLASGQQPYSVIKAKQGNGYEVVPGVSDESLFTSQPGDSAPSQSPE
ncbi:hypothetical protein ACFL13_02335 [Patescibacteria group bacterium]